MGNLIGKVGDIYKGWEILELIKASKNQFDSFSYRVKCNCGFVTRFTKTQFTNRSRLGCKKCSYRVVRKLKIGDKVNNYKVVDTPKDVRTGSILYIFKCIDCGYESKLSHGKRISRPGCANCKMLKSPARQVIIGKKYGKLVVIENREIKRPYRSGVFRFSLCECECGRQLLVESSRLVKGLSVDCRSCQQKKRFGYIDQPKAPKLTEYNDPYLNFCITPRTMDDIIEHFGLSLEEIQDMLMDLMLDEKIEQNRELLWETK